MFNNLMLFEKILYLYFVFLSLLIIIFAEPFGNEYICIAINLLFVIILWSSRRSAQKWHNKWTTFLYYWTPIILFTFMYEEVEPLLHLISNNWCDEYLSLIDQKIFGVNFSLWVEQFDYPFLNEIFTFGYIIYFVIIPVTAAIHYFAGNKSEYAQMLAQVILALCISYILFIFFPAQSPRFYHAHLIQSEMTGLFFSNLEEQIMSLGSYRGGAFPSAHIAVAILCWTSLFRRHRRFFHIMTPFIFLMIIGTIWGRYHYAIDGIAGIFLAFCIHFGFKIKILNKIDKKVI
jgi:membrane-associated phospholipid phosphatase